MTEAPPGSTRSISTDVGIVAATNADLKTRFEEKLFREDLYHRLNVSLTIPPLRERLDDIPRLAAYFLERHSKDHDQKIARRFSASAIERLLAYSWPGNVRELEAVIQWVVVLHSLPVIGPEDIDIDSPYLGVASRTNTLAASSCANPRGLRYAAASRWKDAPEQSSGFIPTDFPLYCALFSSHLHSKVSLHRSC
jgi:DNA-binding NtrC family response regulator